MYIPSFVSTGLRDEDGRSTRGGLSGMGCDQKLASDSSGLSGGFRGIGRGFGL
jgi:hypothetical protein